MLQSDEHSKYKNMFVHVGSFEKIQNKYVDVACSKGIN